MSGNPSLLNKCIQTMIDSALKDTHSAIPGLIDSFDEATQLAKVKPAIKTFKRDGAIIELPVLIKVPLVFPGSGGFTLTFPVASGDEVLLIISDRAMDAWQQSAGVQDPLDERMHDLTDAIAIIGLRSQPNKIEGFLTTGAHLRNSDGTVGILLTDAGIIISGPVLVEGPAIFAAGITCAGSAAFTVEGAATFEALVTCEAALDIIGNSSAADHISGTISGKTHIHSGTGPPL